MKIIRALIAAAVCAITGGYLLYAYHEPTTAFLGTVMIVLSLAIALKAELKDGVTTLREEAEEVKPVIDQIRKGGS